MKQVKQFLFPLVLGVFALNVFAQEQTSSPPKFPIGVYVTSDLFTDPPAAYASLTQLGINYIVEEARSFTQTNAQPFNLIALNSSSVTDVIYHYSNAMYKRWDAERDDPDLEVTGFKHAIDPETQTYLGTVETYQGAICWTTEGLTSPVQSLLFGPNYKQDKEYEKIFYPPYYDKKVTFKVRYRIAFDNPEQLPPSAEVCSLYVMYGVNVLENGQYTEEYQYLPLGGTAGKKTLIVADFPTNGFYTFEVQYDYPDDYIPPEYKREGDEFMIDPSTGFADDIPKTGIEFRLDWRGSGKLYVDYVEVFDDDNLAIQGLIGIGKKFISSHSDVVIEISDYLSDYNITDWDNIKYWYVIDEPSSLDYYYALNRIEEIVDSLTNSQKHVITEFIPRWHGLQNGDNSITKYYELAQPFKLMMDYYPFAVDVTNEFYLDKFKDRLQECSNSDKGFWYVGQGFGQEVVQNSEVYCGWRKPNSRELKASVMLALAYGAKGILFWKYFSEGEAYYSATCLDPVFFDCIVDEDFNPTELYNLIKDNLAPRLTGILGSTLLNLSFNGNDLMLRDVTDPQVEDKNYSNIPYLTLTNNPVNNPINSTLNFFATDLDTTGHSSNNYFLMMNLITEDSRVAEMNVQSSEGVEDRYKNTRLRNIEPENNFDITFYDDTTLTYTFPAGEGYLFQVAPVVLYGGRLLYNETVGGSWTLYDDMIIENGATLTVTGTYNANANITVKDGGSIKTVDGGEIKFAPGKKLIIEGLATLKGTSSQKLTLDFTDPNDNTGIEVLTEGDFTLSKK